MFPIWFTLHVFFIYFCQTSYPWASKKVSVGLSVCLSVCHSVCVSVCVSVCLYLWCICSCLAYAFLPRLWVPQCLAGVLATYYLHSIWKLVVESPPLTLEMHAQRRSSNGKGWNTKATADVKDKRQEQPLRCCLKAPDRKAENKGFRGSAYKSSPGDMGQGEYLQYICLCLAYALYWGCERGERICIMFEGKHLFTNHAMMIWRGSWASGVGCMGNSLKDSTAPTAEYIWGALAFPRSWMDIGSRPAMHKNMHTIRKSCERILSVGIRYARQSAQLEWVLN